MALSYQKKDKAELAFEQSKAQVRTDIKMFMRSLEAEMLNEALAEMSDTFIDRLNRGELVTLGIDHDDLAEQLRGVLERRFGDGDSPKPKPNPAPKKKKTTTPKKTPAKKKTKG